MQTQPKAQHIKNFYGSHVKGDVVIVNNKHYHFEGDGYAERAEKFYQNMSDKDDILSIQSAKTYFGSHCTGTVVVVNEAPEHFQGDNHLNKAIEFIIGLQLPLARYNHTAETINAKQKIA